MYDWLEARDEVDREWAALRDRLRAGGIDAPERLVRGNGDMPAMPGGIRDGCGSVIAPDPATLPPDEFDLPTLWRQPSLLIAQTCWGPMELGLSDFVTVIGQPDYSAFEGGEGELYSSAILMSREKAVTGSLEAKHSAPVLPLTALPGVSPRERGESEPSSPHRTSPHSRGRSPVRPMTGLASRWLAEGRRGAGRRRRGGAELGEEGAAVGLSEIVEALRGKRLAFNSLDSMSGLIALRRDLEAIGESLSLFAERIETGSHCASIIAVAEGMADVCAIDCRTWDLAKRFEPAAARLAIVGWTAKRRGLPYITSRHTPPETVAALRKVLAAGAA